MSLASTVPYIPDSDSDDDDFFTPASSPMKPKSPAAEIPGAPGQRPWTDGKRKCKYGPPLKNGRCPAKCTHGPRIHDTGRCPKKGAVPSVYPVLKKAGRGESCAVAKCSRPLRCHPERKVCLGRGDINIDDEYERALKEEDRRRKPFTQQPGTPNFNAYVDRKMYEDGVYRQLQIDCPKPGKVVPQAYQRTLSYLVHPRSTIRRMLVAWRTGAGKTLGMIRVLNNFYSDPRPKVIVFPNDKVRNNFYLELMQFPNRYRNYVYRRTGRKSFGPKDVDVIIDTLAMKGALRKAGTPGYMKAPLRAMRYTIAGGSTVFGGGRPSNPIFKPYYNGRNPLDGVVLVMDEFHNLYKPDHETQKYQSKLDALKKGIMRAQGSVIVGLTATPLVDSPSDVKQAMRIIKGNEYAKASDEGFVSYFMDMPLSVFPDAGKAPMGEPNIKRVTLVGHNHEAYDRARLKHGIDSPKMANFMCMGQSYRVGIRKGSKFEKLMIEHPSSAASKLDEVVHSVMKGKEKTLIVIHRENGFKALKFLFEQRGMRPKGAECEKGCWASLYEKPTRKDETTLAEFNSPANKRGEMTRVMMVDAKFYSEGVSFKDVRRLILVDMPPSWAAYKQRIGRALRFCGHKNLPRAEWQVQVDLYMATYNNSEDGSSNRTYDERAYEELLRQRDEFDGPLYELGEIASDRKALLVAGGKRKN